jgi:predicted metalloprotease
MQWFGGREGGDVEEGSGGGGRGLALGGGLVGIIGALIYMFTGVNPSQLLGGGGGQDSSQQQNNTQITVNNENMQQKFGHVVFTATEDVWDSIFTSRGMTYQHPTLHYFTGQVDAACGQASAATGPFYCPQDRKVYIDLSFFKELSDKFAAPGLAADAYVIAHEVGHHVQNLLGVSQKMDAKRAQLSETDYNKLSVKLELQADFYAGVWAHYEQRQRAKGIVINRSDIDSALVAAHAIGDDRLQQQYQGRITPDSFTHGTSAQRAYWFKKGFDTGDMKQGTTFEAGDLD